MGITLPPDMEKRIEELTRSGGYGSPAELVDRALDLLEASTIVEDARLREAVAEGLREADRGELVDGEVAFADLRRRIEAVAQGKPWHRFD